MTKEREVQESIEEESKSMEKMANKKAVKLRKVRIFCVLCLFISRCLRVFKLVHHIGNFKLRIN